MTGRAPPDRLARAVAQLDLHPGDRVLEIGCGRGMAASLVCECLRDGHLTALDRSATAISAAARRNREHERAGRVAFLASTLTDAPLDGRFDRIFAINVNVFWLGPERELEVVRRLLAPDGRLYLFFDAPSAAQLDRAARAAAGFLADGGFGVVRELRAKEFACVVASHPAV